MDSKDQNRSKQQDTHIVEKLKMQIKEKKTVRGHRTPIAPCTTSQVHKQASVLKALPYVITQKDMVTIFNTSTESLV